MKDGIEKNIQFVEKIVSPRPQKPIEGVASAIKCGTDSSTIQQRIQDVHYTNLTMKPMDFACRKGLMGEKGLPNVRQSSKFEHGLKRTKRIYLHGSNNDIVSRPMPPPKEHPVELPGIGAQQKRKKCGTICVHDNKILCASSRSKATESGTASSSSHDFKSGREMGMRLAGGESPFGGNSSSATGSGSWTSGNGSTSPRRRIRVPTPIASSPSSSLENGEQSTYISSHRNPRPPSKPRNAFPKSPSTRTGKVFFETDGFDIRNDKGDESDDDQRTPFRPKTPALGKSRHFKATLQNIQEFCPPQDSSESDNYENMKLKRVSKPSSRRRSVGNLLNNRVDGEDDIAVQTRNGRRMSMPVDLHELKDQIDGIRFINVREFSREYIQDILSRRDKEATKGIAGDERRQNKCLSWLQSLEGAL